MIAVAIVALALISCKSKEDAQAVTNEIQPVATDSAEPLTEAAPPSPTPESSPVPDHKPLFSAWTEFGTGKSLNLENSGFGTYIISEAVHVDITYMDCLKTELRLDGYEDCVSFERKTASYTGECAQELTMGGTESDGTILVGVMSFSSDCPLQKQGGSSWENQLWQSCRYRMYNICNLTLLKGGAVLEYKKSNFILQIGEKFYR